jgi:phosphate/sulfate permease
MDSDNISGNEIPKLYSKRVVYIFSILFTCIFGSVLLYSNLKQLNKMKEARHVLIFGIIYTIISIIAVNFILFLMHKDYNTTLTLVVNIIGALIQENLYYKKFIPEKFEKKSFIKPLIISLIIAIPIAALTIFSIMNPD